MRKSISIFLFLIIISSINLFSQVTQEWVRRYNGLGNSEDRGFSIKLDKLGNVIVSGTSGDSLIVIKYNNMGQQIWKSTFSKAIGMRRWRTLDIDSQNNIYILGTGFSNYSNLDIYTVKFDPNGIQCWAKVYSSSGYSSDVGVKIIVGKDGYVYVVGNTNPVQYDYKYVTIKYNPNNGDSVWTRIFDIGGGTGPSDMVLDDKCNIFITGTSGGIATIKYDSSGNLKWVSALEVGTPTAMCIDKQGNIYVTGNYCKTIKYDSSGSIKWVREFNTNYYAFSAASDDSSNVLVCGYGNTVNYMNDFLTIKYNTNGVEQWMVPYLNPIWHSDRALKIEIDKYGNSYVTGSTTFYYIQYLDQITTIKYSNTGNQLWIKNYSYGSVDYAESSDLALDSMLNVYIVGTSHGHETGYDIVTIKYSQPIGIRSISSEVPNSFSLSQNYPNPFNPVTKIKFELPKSTNVKLIIYDALGREITVLVNEKQLAGIYETDWDAANYPSGVYFYKLITDYYSETRKMILLK